MAIMEPLKMFSLFIKYSFLLLSYWVTGANLNTLKAYDFQQFFNEIWQLGQNTASVGQQIFFFYTMDFMQISFWILQLIFCPFQCTLRTSERRMFIVVALVVMLEPNLYLILCCLYCDET